MKNKILIGLSFLPFITFLIFYVVMALSFDIKWILVSTLLLLLFIISLSITSKSKIIQVIGLLSFISYLIMSIIMGYKDYIQWTSAIIGLIVCIYYIIIYFVNKKLRKK